MILTLRQRHRHAFIVLGIFMPVLFAIGIAARKPAPVVSRLPAALMALPFSYDPVGPQRRDLFAKISLPAQILRERQQSNRFAVQFTADQNFLKPDLIVYWAGADQTITDTVPNAAILIGEFGLSALPLPDQATKSSGVLVLYSLADGGIVDVSKPLPLPAANTSTH